MQRGLDVMECGRQERAGKGIQLIHRHLLDTKSIGRQGVKDRVGSINIGRSESVPVEKQKSRIQISKGREEQAGTMDPCRQAKSRRSAKAGKIKQVLCVDPGRQGSGS